MSIISALLNNSKTSYQEAFRARDITSSQMRKALQDWFDLYFKQEASEKEDTCQRIAYTIVRKLTKTVFSEYKAQSDDAFTDGVLKALKEKSMEAVQMALIGGESKLKPVPGKDGFWFTVVPRCNILVFGRDAAGNMTDIGTTERYIDDQYYYTLLERRTVDARGYLTVRNSLYRSTETNDLGQRVPLQSLPQYEQLQEAYTFPQPIGSVGLISVKTPTANCVDGSADAVSVYAAAVGLIHNIDRNEAQLNGEFARGESRIIVSDDMLDITESGKRIMRDNVFVGLDDDQETVGVTIFSPALREQSFFARQQAYLRSVENVIGLKRGLLSEVEAAERTATEITSSAGEYNLTIMDFQRMWETAVREAVRLCGVLGQMYRVPGAHEPDTDTVVISWGNGVLYDEELTNQELKSQVQSGLLQPERYLGWYYDLPCDTPAQRAKIRKDYMPEDLLDGDE